MAPLGKFMGNADSGMKFAVFIPLNGMYLGYWVKVKKPKETLITRGFAGIW
ncbi:MAG: hypothetical protein MI742_12465 [Desulfobacterales bacterium]|nr:hypothetical protein [Desulfobacterales bacterium]